MAKDPLAEQYPGILDSNPTIFNKELERLCIDVENLARGIRYNHIMSQYAKEKYITWAKDSQECLRNGGKKSPNEEQNVSTSSEKRTSMIPLRVPPQHKNATLRVIENPLTSALSLMYSWEDEEGKRHTRFIGVRDHNPPKVQFISETHPFTTGDTY